VADVKLECERYTARASGGQRFLIIPLLWVTVLARWHEEERVEIHGRDTDVQTPIALCAPCHRQLRARKRSWYLLVAVLVLAIGGIIAYFHILTGLGVAALGLAVLALTWQFAWSGRQRALKGLLRKVPVYRQVLERYPRAVVVVRSETAAK
jgi:hypothetical protein